LSNLIKSSHVVSLEDLKKLEFIRKSFAQPHKNSFSDNQSEGKELVDVETQMLKDRILEDAEMTAQTVISSAREEADQIKQRAIDEAEHWWQERREADQQIIEDHSRQGYEQGFESGSEEAQRQLTQEWSSRLQEANAIVTQAYEAKQQIIADAERFAVELSCSIAEKIIGQTLSDAPELAMKLFAGALSRRKEQGVIVLCVSPKQFAFVQAAKDELSMMLDSQAELQIVPDASVAEGGCMVRSAFGSIDARIDTQLDNIKQQLLRVAESGIEGGS
jgi:flagellar assembly protein FliH